MSCVLIKSCVTLWFILKFIVYGSEKNSGVIHRLYLLQMYHNSLYKPQTPGCMLQTPRVLALSFEKRDFREAKVVITYWQIIFHIKLIFTVLQSSIIYFIAFGSHRNCAFFWNGNPSRKKIYNKPVTEYSLVLDYIFLSVENLHSEFCITQD